MVRLLNRRARESEGFTASHRGKYSSDRIQALNSEKIRTGFGTSEMVAIVSRQIMRKGKPLMEIQRYLKKWFRGIRALVTPKILKSSSIEFNKTGKKTTRRHIG